MSKVLIEVYVPATSDTYNLLVPRDITIDNLTELLKKYLSTTVNSAFIIQDDSFLHDYQTGMILNKNKTINEIGIHTGKKLFYL